jgi:hypothetical protein
MLSISLSYCGNYIRIACNDIAITCTLAEWSSALRPTSRFHHTPRPPEVA